MSNRETLRTVSLFWGFVFCHLIRLRGFAARCLLQLGLIHAFVGRTVNRQQGASKSEHSQGVACFLLEHGLIRFLSLVTRKNESRKVMLMNPILSRLRQTIITANTKSIMS